MERMAGRRRFLQAAMMALAAGAAAQRLSQAGTQDQTQGTGGGPEAEPLPIIDTHQHLWDRQRFRLPWIEKGSHLDRNFLMSDYLEATAGLNIVKTVYMEVDVDPVQQPAEAEYVIDLCRRADNPMVAAVISGRPASEGFADYLRAFKDSAYIKGVRQVLHGPTPAGYCLEEKFIRGVRLLGELGLSFDLCMRPDELGDAVKLVDACPDTRFILDHCGNADVQVPERAAWQRGMEQLAKRSRVVCKVSGIVVTARPGKWTAEDLAPIVRHTLDVFGPERVMFGGDWPVCTKTATFRQWLTALQEIVHERKREEQRQLFHDNAVRVYGLE